MASIRDVAERAGVSLGTVSNVLNRPDMVAEETRLRVLRAIEALGFVRNGSAHQLRAGRNPYIGLVVLDIANPFFTEVARGAEDAANEGGYVVILCNSDASPDKESDYLHVLEEQRAQGLLITPVLDDPSYLQRLSQRGIAVTLLDCSCQTTDFCSVAVDDVYGATLAINHLLELGHRRIAFVNGPLSIRQCADRYEGVQKALQAAGLEPEQALLNINLAALNPIEGEKSAEALLNTNERPDAIFCANDLLALGVMRGLHQRGYSVPVDFALVGYDDIDVASVLSTPLTSVRQPKYQLGHTAARLLFDEIANPKTHQHQRIVYQPELIIRESSQRHS
jgi:LacI family transcriptional regulator